MTTEEAKTFLILKYGNLDNMYCALLNEEIHLYELSLEEKEVLARSQAATIDELEGMYNRYMAASRGIF